MVWPQLLAWSVLRSRLVVAAVWRVLRRSPFGRWTASWRTGRARMVLAWALRLGRSAVLWCPRVLRTWRLLSALHPRCIAGWVLLEPIGVALLVAANVDLGVILRDVRVAPRPLPLVGITAWMLLARVGVAVLVAARVVLRPLPLAGALLGTIEIWVLRRMSIGSPGGSWPLAGILGAPVCLSRNLYVMCAGIGGLLGWSPCRSRILERTARGFGCACPETLWFWIGCVGRRSR